MPRRSTRPLARLAATATAALGFTLIGAAVLPSAASAASFTCSGGHLYMNRQRVAGDSYSSGNLTIGCSGDRVVGTIRP
jgi:hypothetical protein